MSAFLHNVYTPEKMTHPSSVDIPEYTWLMMSPDAGVWS